MYAFRLCTVAGLTDWLLLHWREASGLKSLSQLVGSLVVARNDCRRMQTKVFAYVLQFQQDHRAHAENLALGLYSQRKLDIHA